MASKEYLNLKEYIWAISSACLERMRTDHSCLKRDSKAAKEKVLLRRNYCQVIIIHSSSSCRLVTISVVE